jgi:hypothetical protein
MTDVHRESDRGLRCAPPELVLLRRRLLEVIPTVQRWFAE